MTLRGIRSDRLRALARDAIDQGFRVVQTGNGHPVLVSPTGKRVWFSSTANDGYHIAANVRASLIRAGYVPRDRRAPSIPKPVLATPPPVEDVRPPDVETVSEVPAMQAAAPPAAVRGVAFHSKGKAVAADDVIIGGQPFRIRTNADGSIDATTLRRTGAQRTWSRKSGGDLLPMRKAILDWVMTVEPWETPMPDTYVNGAAGQAHAPELEVERQVEPEPIGPEAAAVDAFVERVRDRSTVIAAFVDPDDYPIARALDDLERAVMPAVLALEAAGKSEAAELIRVELAKSPAEVELLALYREVNQRPRIERRD